MKARLLLVAAMLASASIAAAQTAAPAQAAVHFVPRYDFHLAADHLSTSDPRFVWDTNFGGAIDFVDYGRGRVTFTANYEAILGKEFRAFDPNQGNYLLDMSSSWRTHGVETAAVFHHTSRHLSDRPKRIPVDWNMFGASVEKALHHGGADILARGNALGVLLRSNVDYNWEANAGVQVRVPVRTHISTIAAGNLRVVGVNGEANRGNQQGGRVEGGLRLEGERGAIELILSAERRIDPYPLDRGTLSWFGAGFRFVSR